jgi:DNA-directed RNA polymerase specialized sigma24 family protein
MSTFEKAKSTLMTGSTEIDWAVAYEELLPKVYHYFCLRIGDRLEAEDLTAATFEGVWLVRERL